MVSGGHACAPLTHTGKLKLATRVQHENGSDWHTQRAAGLVGRRPLPHKLSLTILQGPQLYVPDDPHRARHDACGCNPSTLEVVAEDCFRLAWAMYQDPVQKKKKNRVHTEKQPYQSVMDSPFC